MEADLMEQAADQASICGVFGNAHRVLILWALGGGERSVSDIASITGCSMQNASQHLRLMKDKGILASRREGNAVFYRIERNELMDGCRLLGMARRRPFEGAAQKIHGSNTPVRRNRT
jgi:DNA-binding transcriptional ArsR family regulator